MHLRTHSWHLPTQTRPCSDALPDTDCQDKDFLFSRAALCAKAYQRHGRLQTQKCPLFLYKMSLFPSLFLKAIPCLKVSGFVKCKKGSVLE